MNRPWDMAERSSLPPSPSLRPAGRLEELVPEDALIVAPLQVMARNGMFMENCSTSTVRTSHYKAPASLILDAYTMQSSHMQERTEQPVSPNSELNRITKPESKWSPVKQQNLDVKKRDVAPKMREQPTSPNSELKKLVNQESNRSSEKRQNLNVKKQHIESKMNEYPAPSNSERNKLTNPESKRSSEKQQNMDVKKQDVESKMCDAQKYLNSSRTKEANALEIPTATVESHNLATTNTINRISEESEEDDDANEKEEEDGVDVDNEGSDNDERKAPLELMGEFLKAIMDRDYKLSSKLCQMILIYEPENPEAQQFKILLDVKNQLDEAASTDQNDEEDGTESDSDEDENEDSSNEDSDESESSDEVSDDSSGSEKTT
ncbi:glutamate-rich protein 2 isoform X2 [Scyliorhinus canicula]|uniref:glutamate-rich protein 2 isoform X2 n=1 Tax=Scyliorhinus canicula TaxID=7830 RepID=UPI0018F526F1|nr:glutamate-rich protein 2 isoform X2 [Scyliorhinus canicula]